MLKNKDKIVNSSAVCHIVQEIIPQYSYKRYLLIVLVHLMLLFLYFIWKNIGLFLPEELPKGKILMRNYQNMYITYSQEAINLDPFSILDSTKARTSFIYEALIKNDENLNLKPQLALSWGKIDNLTWEFKLRPNVRFHNGNDFNADDVIDSFYFASKLSNSQIGSYLSNIEKIVKLDPLKIRIKTYQSDPLLLAKLTAFNILSSTVIQNQDPKEISLNPVGTGPYKFEEWKNNKYLKLVFNADYYKSRPAFDNLYLNVIANKHERIASIRHHMTDILVDVPLIYIGQLENKFNYQIKQVPSLEAMFILFNFKNQYLKNREIRLAFKKAIDPDKIFNFVGQYGVLLNQFVSPGVFGFNPEIKNAIFDLESARAVITAQNSKTEMTITLALTEQNKSLGEAIQQLFKNINIKVELVLLSEKDLLFDLKNKKSDLYLIGWRYNLGDVQEFFDYFVKSQNKKESAVLGQYNLNYKNQNVDDLIQLAEAELDERERLKLLQKIMKVIVEDDIIGIPLFQIDKIFAIAPDISYKPRMDGVIVVER